MSFISNGVYENQTMSAIAWVHYFYIVSGQTSDFILYPRKQKKTFDFPVFLGGIEWKIGKKLINQPLTIKVLRLKFYDQLFAR